MGGKERTTYLRGGEEGNLLAYWKRVRSRGAVPSASGLAEIAAGEESNKPIQSKQKTKKRGGAFLTKPKMEKKRKRLLKATYRFWNGACPRGETGRKLAGERNEKKTESTLVSRQNAGRRGATSRCQSRPRESRTSNIEGSHLFSRTLPKAQIVRRHSVEREGKKEREKRWRLKTF